MPKNDKLFFPLRANNAVHKGTSSNVNFVNPTPLIHIFPAAIDGSRLDKIMCMLSASAGVTSTVTANVYLRRAGINYMIGSASLGPLNGTTPILAEILNRTEFAWLQRDGVNNRFISIETGDTISVNFEVTGGSFFNLNYDITAMGIDY